MEAMTPEQFAKLTPEQQADYLEKLAASELEDTINDIEEEDDAADAEAEEEVTDEDLE